MISRICGEITFQELTIVPQGMLTLLCRLDEYTGKDWLVVAYNQGPHVPITRPETILKLHGANPDPDDD